jgi:hypothetical protein
MAAPLATGQPLRSAEAAIPSLTISPGAITITSSVVAIAMIRAPKFVSHLASRRETKTTPVPELRAARYTIGKSW